MKKLKTHAELESMLCDMRNKVVSGEGGIVELQQVSKEIKQITERLDKLEFERASFGVALKKFIDDGVA